MANCQLIKSKSLDFYKIEHCSYMREGEGSILGTFELVKLQKVNIFVSLCDNSAHTKYIEQKISWIVKNYMLNEGTE